MRSSFFRRLGVGAFAVCVWMCFASWCWAASPGAKAAKTRAAKRKKNQKSQPKQSVPKRTQKPTIRRVDPRPRRRRSMPVFSSVTRVRRFRPTTASSNEVGQKQLETYSRSQAADVFQAVPGLLMSQHAGRGKAHQFFLRGFDAVHGSELEIRVQGIPLNESSNIHGQGYADLGILMPFSMLRVRYLKGPFAGHQGDFAITGSLEVDLGLEQRGLTVQAGIDNFLRREIAVAWGPRGMGKESFVAAQLAESNGFGTGRGWSEGRLLAQFQWRVRQFQLRLLVGGHYGRFDSAGILREVDLQQQKVGFYDAQQEGLGGHSGRFLGQLSLLWRGEQQRASLMVYAMGRDLRLKENFTGFLLSDQGDTFEQSHSFLQTGTTAHYRRTWYWFGRRQRLRAGAEFRFDAIQQAQHRVTVSGQRHKTEIDANVQTYQASVWSTLQLRLARWLWWDATLRANVLGIAVEDIANNDIRGPSRQGTGMNLLPRTVVRFRLARRWNLFAAYGMGYRSVQARSLRDRERVPFQEAHNAEIGVRFQWRRWAEVSLAVFGVYMAQELIFDHASATNTYAGASWRVGGELNFRVRLYLPWLWLDTSLTYSEGWFATTNEPVPFAPRLLMRNGLVARWKSKSGLWRILAGVRTSLLGPRPLPLGFEADTVFLLNAFARVQVGPVFVRIEANNILNSQWKDGQFVYASTFVRGAGAQKLPQLHFTAGPPFQVFVRLGVNLF